MQDKPFDDHPTALRSDVVTGICRPPCFRTPAWLGAFKVGRLDARNPDLLSGLTPKWAVAVMDADHLAGERRQGGSGKQRRKQHLSGCHPVALRVVDCREHVTIGLLLAEVSTHGFEITVLWERPVGPRRIATCDSCCLTILDVKPPL